MWLFVFCVSSLRGAACVIVTISGHTHLWLYTNNGFQAVYAKDNAYKIRFTVVYANFVRLFPPY